MLRKIVFVLLALSLPLLAASAASAQQYPPSGDGPTATTVVESGTASDSAGAGSAPLARTGTDLTVPLAVGGVLLAGGAVALVVSRRRPTSLV